MCHHLSQNDAKRRKKGVKPHEIGAKRRETTQKRRENNAKNAAPPPKIGGLDPSLYIYTLSLKKIRTFCVLEDKFNVQLK